MGVGKSLSEISRAIGYPPVSIYTVIKATGGYVPPARKRRADIARAGGDLSRSESDDSLRQLARVLGRSASTISREVAKNKGRCRSRAVAHAKRPKKCLLSRNPVPRGYVASRLRGDWSPEQVAGTLKKRHPAGSRMRVLPETIYRSLFVQTRGVLARDLLKHLRSGRPTRPNIHNTVTLERRSQIKDAVSIRERPAEVEDRAVPGHWEDDLIIGRHCVQMATVVERSSRFTFLAQLDSRDIISVSAGLSRETSKLPQHLRKSLTWDRGMELADHKTVTANTGLDIYFADPRSPWQRGTNENTNGLLEWAPKVGLHNQSIQLIREDCPNAFRKYVDPRGRCGSG